MPLRHLTARTRSEAANWGLASVLTLTAGMVDVSGFLAMRQYSSHMSGLMAELSWQTVLDGPRSTELALTILASFLSGAAACALVINRLRRLQWEGQFAIPVLFEALLLGAASCVASPSHAFLTAAMLAFTMGLQNAIVTKISHKEIRTTHVTGTLTDIGIEVGRLLYWNRHERGEPVRADIPHLLLLCLLVGLFFLGGVLSAWGFPRIGFRLLMPFAIGLALLAVYPIRADLRKLA